MAIGNLVKIRNMENLDLIKPVQILHPTHQNAMFDDPYSERMREKTVVVGSNDNGLDEDAERLRWAPPREVCSSHRVSRSRPETWNNPSGS